MLKKKKKNVLFKLIKRRFAEFFCLSFFCLAKKKKKEIPEYSRLAAPLSAVFCQRGGVLVPCLKANMLQERRDTLLIHSSPPFFFFFFFPQTFMEVKVAAFSQRPPSSSIRTDENRYKSLPTSVSFPSYVLSSLFFFAAQCSATLPL